MNYDFNLSDEAITRIRQGLGHAVVNARIRAVDAVNNPTTDLAEVRKLCDEYATLLETLEWWCGLSMDILRGQL